MLKQNVEQRQSEKLGGKSLVFSWNVWKIQKRFRETCYGFCAKFAHFFGHLLEIPGAIFFKSGRGLGKLCDGFRAKKLLWVLGKAGAVLGYNLVALLGACVAVLGKNCRQVEQQFKPYGFECWKPSSVWTLGFEALCV